LRIRERLRQGAIAAQACRHAPRPFQLAVPIADALEFSADGLLPGKGERQRQIF